MSEKDAWQWPSAMSWTMGLVAGLVIGIVLGLVMDSIGVGIALGISIGAGFAFAFSEFDKRRATGRTPAPREGDQPPT